MKNTSSGPEESFFKKKGFFVALYSTLGAVIVLALVVTFTNLSTAPSDDETAEGQTALEESANVSADDVATIDQQEADRELSDEQAWWRATPKPSPSAPAAPSAAPAAPKTSPRPAASPSETPKSPAPVVPATPTPAPDKPEPAADAEQEEQEEAASETESDFTPFAENDTMLWPVEGGEIVMNYSMDDLIYDPTLDQHRTNDDIRIAAKEGAPVKATADGRVLEIGNDHVYGTYVTIDHGNGVVSTYGQLMDGVLVDKDEVVSAGQVIGGVGLPSYFGSLNGTHLNLRVTKEGEPVDPNTLLAAAEEE